MLVLQMEHTAQSATSDGGRMLQEFPKMTSPTVLFFKQNFGITSSVVLVHVLFVNVFSNDYQVRAVCEIDVLDGAFGFGWHSKHE